MGLLFLETQADVQYQQRQEAEAYHKAGCKLCPLAKIKENCNPDMPASGAPDPLVYILGEGPGAAEDEDGVQFVGKSGQFLRARIPRQMKSRVRFNNVVRTRPPGNATPDYVAVECCRPSIIADIERTKPKAIFGFGNVPLNWASGFSGPMAWRGRKMPVTVGRHTCWFYSFMHPAFILRQGDQSEDAFAFTMDMKRAFAEVEDLPEAVVHTEADAEQGIECLTSIVAIKQAFRWAATRPLIGVDLETNRLRPYEAGAKILTAGLSDGHRSIAFPIDHPQANFRKNERDDLVNIFMRFLEQYSGIKAVHMLSFELEWLGVKLGRSVIRAGKWEDTATQASIIDERTIKVKPGPLSLEFLVQQYFGFNLKKLSGIDTSRGRAKLENERLPVVLRYNAMDAKYHALLWGKQHKRIASEGLQVPYQLALRAVPTVVLSQIKGMPVDQKEVILLKKKYEARVADIEKQITALSIVKKFKKLKSIEFNPGSGHDVLFVFWDMLKRKECQIYDRKAKKDRLSVDEEILKQIDHPLSPLVIAFRKASRQLSTYILPLVPKIKQSVIFSDTKVHTVFNTILTRTGRLSSDSPNMQNYPKRSEEGKEVRKPFKAKPGDLVVAIDLGQIEARVIAMATKDPRFCKALWEDFDVHMDWAERIAYEYPARIGGKKFLKDKKVLKTFRTDIKNQWTFPLFFGATLDSAASYLNIPASNLRVPYNQFWKEFSGVKDWQETLMDDYRRDGYVQTLTGRRRHAPISLNKVINSPIQGTAAEIVKTAMAQLSEIGDWALQPELNIHDDLTWISVPEDDVESHVEKALNIMLDPPFGFINVPITAEVSLGPNWADLHEEGVFSSQTWFKDKKRKRPSYAR
jgi:uracil-DNA glycosylase family 4